MIMNNASSHQRQKYGYSSPEMRRRLVRNSILRQPSSFLVLLMFCIIATSWTEHQASTVISSSRSSFVFAADHDIPNTSMTDAENDQSVQRRQQQQEEGAGRREVAKKQASKILSSSSSSSATKKLTLQQILIRAGKRGLGGGIPGAMAGVIQVLSLMWLRTVTNYQCRYGTGLKQSLITLLNEGGIPRLYRGMGFALIQAPISYVLF
jgi:hypothetical protein